MGRPRSADGVLVGGISRLALKPGVADAVRAEATLRGITLSVAVLEMLALYQQERLQPKTVVDPRLPPAARRPKRELPAPTPPAAPAPPTAPTLPSPAPGPPTSAQAALLGLFDAALRRRGLEPVERLGRAPAAAALQEVFATAKTMAVKRGRSPTQLFEHWLKVYLDEACDPSPIDMAMQMYRLVAS